MTATACTLVQVFGKAAEAEVEVHTQAVSSTIAYRSKDLIIMVLKGVRFPSLVSYPCNSFFFCFSFQRCVIYSL
jgi:hypothetical protein